MMTWVWITIGIVIGVLACVAVGFFLAICLIENSINIYK